MGSKRLKGFIFLFLIISLLGLISAESCRITPKSSCDSQNILMALSSQTNAHGGLLASSPSYNYVVCCDFPCALSDCTGKSPVLKLSSITNAHAEIPSGINYNTIVCYNNLICQSFINSCSSNYSIPVISLSTGTNSHIGAFNDYTTKICCKKIGIITEIINTEGNIARTDPWYPNYNEESEYEEGMYQVLDNATGTLMGVSGADVWVTKTINGSTYTYSLFNLYGVKTDANGKITYKCNFVSETFPKNTIETCTVTGDITNTSTTSKGDLRGEYTEKAYATITLDGFQFNSTESNTLSFSIVSIIPSAHWEDENMIYIGEGTSHPNLTVSTNQEKNILVSLKDSRISQGAIVTFEVWEEDGLLNPDDYITTINASALNSRATGIWKVNTAEIDSKTNDYDDFYFKTSTNGTINVQETSNNLKLIKYNPNLEACEKKSINTCEQYDTEDSCKFNDCSVNDFGDINTCGKETRIVPGHEPCHYEVACDCGWDADGGIYGKGSCGPISKEVLTPECVPLPGPDEDPYPSILGECNILQLPENDNCDDGFLSYKWNAIWDWKGNNYSSASAVPHTTEIPIQTLEGYWHYPTLLVDSCTGGEKIIPCPTSLALPFSGALQLIATLIIIALIYYFILRNKKKKSSKNLSRKKKR